MQYLPNPEQRPAFTISTSNEAYALDIVARQFVGDIALSKHVKSFRQDVVNGRVEPSALAFIGNASTLLLSGLERAVCNMPRTDSRYPIIEDMLNDYQNSLAEATTNNSPQLEVAA
jgi:hypothetical protein